LITISTSTQQHVAHWNELSAQLIRYRTKSIFLKLLGLMAMQL